MAILTTTQAGLNFVGGTTYIQTGTTTLMAIATNGNIQFSQYGAGTLVTDASGNITVSSGGGAGGPYLPVANPTFTGTLTGPIGSFTTSVSALQFYSTNNGNGTNYKIGDDVWIGDINVANTFRVQGAQNPNNGYITFGNSSNTALGRAGTGPLTWGGDMTISGVLQAQINANSTLATGTGWNLNSTYLGQSIYSSGGGDNNGSTFDTARYKSAQLWGRSGTTWTDLGSAAAMLAGNNGQNYTTLILTHNAYDEYIIFMGQSLGYTFINNTTLTHSTQGNTMDLYLESKESVTNPYEAGWTSITSVTGISSWPGGTSITKAFGIGGGYNNNFRLRIVPNWSSNATNYNIGVGSLQMFASYGNPACAYTTTWDDTDKNTIFHGNVGIGTSSPANKLNVNGDIGYIGVIGQGSIYGNTGNASFSTMQLYDPSTGYTTLNNQSYGYYFNTSGGTKVTILNSGDVGIGTTDPRAPLVISNSSTDGLEFHNSISSSSRIISYKRSNDTFRPLRLEALTHIFSISGNEKMRIDSSGNVGIGTSNPDAQLEISNPNTTSGAGGATLRLTRADGTSVAGDPVGTIEFYSTDADAPKTTAYIKSMSEELYGREGSLAFGVSQTINADATEAMRIDSNGNVGINTTNPDYKLDVEGDISLVGAGENYAIMSPISQGMQIAVGDPADIATPLVTFDGANQRVGIGTTSPGAKLAIEGDATGDDTPHLIIDSGGVDNNAIIHFTDDEGGQVNAIGALEGNMLTFASVNELIFKTGTGSILGNTDTRMTIDTNGDVGIGIINPLHKIDVYTNTDNSYIARFSQDHATGWGVLIDTDGTSNGDPALWVKNASNTILWAAQSGNVGINTTTPAHLLDVRDGTSSGAIARFSAINAHVIIESTSAGPAVLHFKPNITGNKSGQFKVTTGEGYNFRWSNDAASTAEVTYMKLDTSTTGGGDLTVKGDIIAYGAPSDERYKENIKPIESALDKAVKLQGVTFDWKESDSILDIKEDIGFIAQDVQKVVPELVRENEDGKLSLRYQGVTPILLEAIKELKAEIDLLKSKPCNCNNCNCSI